MSCRKEIKPNERAFPVYHAVNSGRGSRYVRCEFCEDRYINQKINHGKAS